MNVDIPRESIENYPITVDLHGTTITAGFTVALYKIGEERPAEYQAPIVDGELTAVHVEGLTPGAYAIQVKYDDGACRDLEDTITIT